MQFIKTERKNAADLINDYLLGHANGGHLQLVLNVLCD